MIEKPEEKEVVQENALAMIQCKVLKQLEVLLGQKIEDPDITEDITFLAENLQSSMVDLRLVAPLNTGYIIVLSVIVSMHTYKGQYRHNQQGMESEC